MYKELMDKVDLTRRRLKQDRNININMTYDEIAEVMGISTKEVKELEASAIRKIRHPRIGKKLRDYVRG